MASSASSISNCSADNEQPDVDIRAMASCESLPRIKRQRVSCSWLNVILLLNVARKYDVEGLGLQSLIPALLRISAATIMAALAGAVIFWAVDSRIAIPSQLIRNAVVVLVPMATGAIVYLAAAMVLRCPEVRELMEPILRKIKRAGAGTRG